MDYLGGTYVSQFEAHGELEAMNHWARNLPIDEIDGLTDHDKKVIINKGFADDDAVLLTGLKNVWCFDIITQNGFAMINIIKTQQ